jgi:hypothetical protein
VALEKREQVRDFSWSIIELVGESIGAERNHKKIVCGSHFENENIYFAGCTKMVQTVLSR